MEFTFYYPVKLSGADGLRFIAAEIEMKVEIEIDPRDCDEWYVTALYAACLEGSRDWIEVRPGTVSYEGALKYLREDKEAQSNLATEIDEWLVENRPSRGLRVHENSTHWGRP